MTVKHDAEMKGVSTVESFRKLVGFVRDDLGLKPVLYRDYCKDPAEAGIVLVRHDVDHSIDNALMLARIEADMGLRSTYFMLHPGDYDNDENYYGRIENGRIVHQPDFFARCREIAAMGHEIGIHNDFFQLSFLTGRPIRELLLAEVEAFHAAGIPVAGSASHGSTFVREIEAVNYEIFAECVSSGKQRSRIVKSGTWEAETHTISLADVGLDYEAYFVPRNMDISDTGSAVALASRTFRADNMNLTSDEAYDLIRKTVAEIDGVRLVMLIHPCWWNEIVPPFWAMDGILPSGLKRMFRRAG